MLSSHQFRIKGSHAPSSPRYASFPSRISDRIIAPSLKKTDTLEGSTGIAGIPLPIGPSSTVENSSPPTLVAESPVPEDIPQKSQGPTKSGNISYLSTCSITEFKEKVTDLHASLPPSQLASELAAICNALLSVWKAGPQGLPEMTVIGDVLLTVYSVATSQLLLLRPKDKASIIATLSELPSCDNSILQLLTEATKGQLEQVPAQQLAAILKAMSGQGVRPSLGWLGEYMSEVQGRLSELSVHDQVSVLGGLVRLGVKPTPMWLGSFLEASAPDLQALSCADLSTLANACGEIRFQPPDEAWMARFLSASQFASTRACDSNSETDSQSTPSRTASPSDSQADSSNSRTPVGLLLDGQPLPGPSPPSGSQAQPSQANPSPANPSQTNPSQANPSQANPSQANPSQANPSQASPSQANPSQANPNQGNRSQGNRRSTPAAPSSTAKAIQPNELSDLLWGLSLMTTQPLPTEWTESFLTISQQLMPQFKPPDVVRLAAAAASLNLRPTRRWMETLVSHSCQALQRYSARDLAELMVALASLLSEGMTLRSGVKSKWGAVFLKESQAKLPIFTVQALPQVLSAMVRFKLQPGQAWLNNFSDMACSKISVMSPSDLSTLTVALSDIGHEPSEQFLDAIVAQSLSPYFGNKLATLGNAEAVALLGALGRLGAEPDADTRRALLQECRRRLPKFTAPELADMLVGLVKMRVKPPTVWMTQFYACVDAQLATYMPDSLTELLWAITVGHFHPPKEWMDRVMDQSELVLTRSSTNQVTTTVE